MVPVISSGVQNSTFGFETLGLVLRRVLGSILYRFGGEAGETPGTNCGGRDMKGNLELASIYQHIKINSPVVIIVELVNIRRELIRAIWSTNARTKHLPAKARTVRGPGLCKRIMGWGGSPSVALSGLVGPAVLGCRIDAAI